MLLPPYHTRARNIWQQRVDSGQKVVQRKRLDEIDIDIGPLINAVDCDVGGDDHNLCIRRSGFDGGREHITVHIGQMVVASTASAAAAS